MANENEEKVVSLDNLKANATPPEENSEEKMVEDEVKEIPQMPTSGLDMRAGMKDPLQALYEREAEKKRAAEEEAARAEAERKAQMAPIERIMEKYGCDEDIATLIMKKRVRRGMTAEQCRAAWGRPQDINRTSGSYGVHEQWVYGGHNYLYFEDGILTTIQN